MSVEWLFAEGLLEIILGLPVLAWFAFGLYMAVSLFGWWPKPPATLGRCIDHAVFLLIVSMTAPALYVAALYDWLRDWIRGRGDR